MTTVGQIERKTQARVVALFRERLGYAYLGNRIDRDNRNIEPELLTSWLKRQGIGQTLITRALHEPEGFTIREDVSAAWTIDSQTTRILELATHQHDY